MTDAAKNTEAKPEGKPHLTRIPIEQVIFIGGAEPDLPGSAMAPSVTFGQGVVKERPYFLGFFVPSHQIIDIEYHRDGEDPVIYSVPMCSVRRMKRSKRS